MNGYVSWSLEERTRTPQSLGVLPDHSSYKPNHKNYNARSSSSQAFAGESRRIKKEAKIPRF